jgi:hypothetical protein
MKILVSFMIPVFSVTLLAQTPPIRLYDGPAPGSEQWTHKEQENRDNQGFLKH